LFFKLLFCKLRYLRFNEFFVFRFIYPEQRALPLKYESVRCGFAVSSTSKSCSFQMCENRAERDCAGASSRFLKFLFITLRIAFEWRVLR